MKCLKLGLVCLLPLGMLAACSTGREVDVTGEITAAQAVAGPISVEFFELAKGVDNAQRVSIKKVELTQTGAFTETIQIGEDIVVAVALVDADGDGKCTNGELWGEAQQEAKADGTFAALQITLTADPCPTPAP